VRLAEGGTTPPPELIQSVKRTVRIPVFVLVRPRAGDFVYAASELRTMQRDIASAIGAGADGIVTGALTAKHRLDVDGTQGLVKAARGIPVTFHRAFDEVHNRPEVLEQLIELGFTRILTSGGAAAAKEGVESIAELVRKGGQRIEIAAGGGVRAHNVVELLRRSRVREVHARLVDETGMRDLVATVRGYDSRSA
jgi:copper homeostasis protein